MDDLTTSIWAMILSGVLALFICSFAYQRHFFKLPPEIAREKEVRFDHLLFIFGIYLLTTIFLTKIIYQIINYIAPDLSWAGDLAWLNFITFSCVLFLFIIYFSFMDKQILKGIFKRNFPEKKSIWFDLGMGVLGVIIALPLTQFFSLLIELILTVTLNIKQVPDQSAVTFLKSTLNSPTYFLLAVITISILAPLLEEIVYRGFLQSFLKKYIGRNMAIIATGFLFAISHFTLDQKLANVSIIAILFIFGLMLGFIYERQKSLFASISLHSVFNTLNIINLLIFKDQSIL